MNDNPFAIAAQQSGNVQIASTRAAQETQAAMVIAKRFPRNEEQAIQRIQQSCKRRSLAEVACYAYPRGSTTVTGPSIRLAECLAQNWGNMEFGIMELEQKNGESTVMAFCWDLETNTRETKIFQVKHERRVGKGKDFHIDKLEDPRDIYELVANQGARRLRSCILGVIPGDVVDIAVDQCEKTLASGHTEPLIDRARKMAAVFADYGVTVAMLEKRLGHKLDACIEQELANLRKIYTSLKDGAGKREDFFEVVGDAPKPAKFEGDEKTEADAGLAPASPAPQTVPPEGARARSKAKTQESQPVNPVPPAPTAKSPEQPQPSPQSDAQMPAEDAPVIEKVLALCRRDGINESEVLDILKRRKLARPEWDQLLEVNDQHLLDLIASWDVIHGQVNIDRRGKKTK